MNMLVIGLRYPHPHPQLPRENPSREPTRSMQAVLRSTVGSREKIGCGMEFLRSLRGFSPSMVTNTFPFGLLYKPLIFKDLVK